MKTIDVISHGKRLCVEICEVWDFVRDIHAFQAYVTDKRAFQRYLIGYYKTTDIAEHKAKEWINEEKMIN